MTPDRPDDAAEAEVTTGDESWRAGVEHLQAAALEMIAATRALLDAAEAVVEDPRSAASTVDLLSSMVSMAARPRPGRERSAAEGSEDPDDGEPPVQRIPVT